MDLLSDKYIPFSAVWHTVLAIVEWPIRFFTLTQEDQLKAGIYMGGEERDGWTNPGNSFSR